jgi:hypothetical protein
MQVLHESRSGLNNRSILGIPISFCIVLLLSSVALSSARQGDVAQDTGCAAIRPVYGQGREQRRVSCAHGSRGNNVGIVTIGVDTSPAGKVDLLPFGYIVVIWNDSDDRINVDWTDWTISWTNRRGQRVSSAPLDPDRYPVELMNMALRKTTLSGGQHVVGWIYFDRPGARTADLTASVAGVARFRFSVSAEPKP